jgi:TPP-dependent pyruvate/acetoin dehydrogenase alpha subunit
MNPSARLFHCARCHCQVILCRHCDRGNVYCANGCADYARTTSLRRAAIRYRATRRGRHSNADRQRRFRARQQEKVTHQGSPPIVGLVLLLFALNALERHQEDHRATSRLYRYWLFIVVLLTDTFEETELKTKEGYAAFAQ